MNFRCTKQIGGSGGPGLGAGGNTSPDKRRRHRNAQWPGAPRRQTTRATATMIRAPPISMAGVSLSSGQLREAGQADDQADDQAAQRQPADPGAGQCRVQNQQPQRHRGHERTARDE